MYDSNDRDILDTEAVYRLFWVRPDGTKGTAVVTLPHDSGQRSLRYSVAALAHLLSPWRFSASSGRGNYKRKVQSQLSPLPSLEPWSSSGQLFAIAQVLAVILAVLCYRRQARYGVSRTERIVWPLFVLVLGLPGWIGYRFGRSWPVLESCPECGTAVPRDREGCLRCTNDFPRPALKETEVFA